MSSVLHWQKGIFSCSYQLLSKGNKIGALKARSYARSATGMLHGTSYRFKTQGLWKKKTEIFDPKTGKSIGKIHYNCWLPEARIEYGEEVLYWKFDSLLPSRWSIYDESGEKISYRGWSANGQAKSALKDDFWMLTGLFISNYYWELGAILVTCLSSCLIFLV